MSIQINTDDDKAQSKRNLINQGGSIGMTIPKSIADRLDIEAGMTVTVVDDFSTDTSFRIETSESTSDSDASQDAGGDGT